MDSNMDLFLDRVVQYNFDVFLWEPITEKVKVPRKLLSSLKSKRNLVINLDNYPSIFFTTLLQNEFCHGTDCFELYEKTIRELLLTGPLCEKCTELNRKLLQLFRMIKPDLICELCNSVLENYNFSWAKDQRILCMKCRFTNDCQSNLSLCKYENCERCFLKSFASSLYSINCVGANPRQIYKKSSKKYEIRCPDCKHVNLQRPVNLNKEEVSCGFCFGIHLCPEPANCVTCRMKSVGSSINGTRENRDSGLVWSTEDNQKSEWEVFFTSRTAYMFVCRKCNHKIQKSPYYAYLGNCGFCTHSYCCTEDKNCEVCRARSVGGSKLGDNDQYKHLTVGFQWVVYANDLSQWEVGYLSDREAIFVCRNPDCGHQIKGPINNVYYTNCPYCMGKKLCSVEDNCQVCRSKSVGASHIGSKTEQKVGLVWDVYMNKMSEWEVSVKSREDAYFLCRHDKCGHLMIKTIYKAIKRGCGYCNNTIMCDEYENCTICRERSIGNSDLSPYSNKLTGLEWVIDKNTRSMWEIPQSSIFVAIFKCRNCGHLVEKRVLSTSYGCSYCHNLRICPDEENCTICRKKSVGSAELQVIWDEKKNDKTKWEVSTGCATPYFWLCNKGHSWEAQPFSVCKNGQGCPICRNKTEGKLHAWLQKVKPETIYQFKPEWVRDPITLRLRSYDFCIEEYKLIMELDGGHRWVSRIGIKFTPPEVCEKDIVKQRLARENGYTLIRISQMDVWTDETDWKSDLQKLFFLRRKPRLIFLATDRRYKSHHIPKHPDCQGIKPIFVRTIPIK